MRKFRKGDEVILTIPGASLEVREVIQQTGDWVLIRRPSTGLQWTYKASELKAYEPDVCPI